MNIFDFSHIPVKEKPTFVLYPSDITPELEYALRTAHMTGWTIIPFITAEHRIRDRAFTQAAHQMNPETTDVLVSWFDSSAMLAKIQEIHESPEIKQWKNETNAAKDRLSAYSNAWDKDPPPCGFERPTALSVPDNLFNRTALKQTDHLTFYFFPTLKRREMNVALQSAMATGWVFCVPNQIKHLLPEDFEIPEVRLTPTAPRIEKNVTVLVSRFDVKTLADAFENLGPDSKLMQWFDKKAADAAIALDYEKAWQDNPPPAI